MNVSEVFEERITELQTVARHYSDCYDSLLKEHQKLIAEFKALQESKKSRNPRK